MSITINILQVKHGDAFVLECQQGGNKGVIVVDGGPQSTNKVFKDALALYPTIDLLVLTHYDEDHIGGILSYFRSCLSCHCPLKIKEIWANCASSINFDENKDLSLKQAIKLSNILQEYVDQGILVWRADICEGIKVDLKFANIEVLSPTHEVLVKTTSGIQKEMEKSDLTLSISTHHRQSIDLDKSLEELALNEKKAPDLNDPNQLSNASSIAFMIECDGTKVLMLGDAYPQKIADYIKYKSTEEGKELPRKVDYVKVSHHGSRNNISNELLDVINCQNYIISTNGGKGITCHPDRETIANIVCHPTRDISKKVNLFFNYSKTRIEQNGCKFINAGEEQKYCFEIIDNTTKL